MNEFTQMLNVSEILATLESWIHSHVLVVDNAVQAGLILLALGAARLLGPRLRGVLENVSENQATRTEIQGFLSRLADLSTPIIALVFLWIVAEAGAQSALLGHYLIQTAAILTGAWVTIRLASGVIRNELLSRIVAWAAWSVAALAALGLFDASVTLLDGVSMTFGEVRVSLLSLVKAALILVLLLWFFATVSAVLERRIGKSKDLTPSAQVLITKIIKIVLIVLAFLIAIGGLGIDLTALTVFGGALGIGVGIGMQKVVSNLVSGLLLLMDKSIKPNDVIAVGGTYGWVASLGARYAAIRTRDGVEYLIPNEELITQRVENWTHSDQAVRLNIPVGISYKSDVRLAIDLCRQAAAAVPRVLSDPAPRCLLMSFGDSSINLEIRLWINDPSEGRSNIISEILLRVWDLFHENGIEIPFPQRDLHLKSSDIPLSMQAATGAG